MICPDHDVSASNFIGTFTLQNGMLRGVCKVAMKDVEKRFMAATDSWHWR